MTKQRHLVFSGFPRVFLPFPGLSKHNDRHFQTPSFRGTAAQIYPTKLHIQFLFAFVMPIINGCLLEVSEKFFKSKWYLFYKIKPILAMPRFWEPASQIDWGPTCTGKDMTIWSALTCIGKCPPCVNLLPIISTSWTKLFLNESIA